MDIRRINSEIILYTLAIVLAVGLRFYNLGAPPLSDEEARWAMQALQVARPALTGGDFVIGPGNIADSNETVIAADGGANRITNNRPIAVDDLCNVFDGSCLAPVCSVRQRPDIDTVKIDNNIGYRSHRGYAVTVGGGDRDGVTATVQ